MRQTRELFRLFLMTLAVLAAATCAPLMAHAAEGYWRYVDTQFAPSEADFVAMSKNPGRIPERHVSGGFQAEYSGQGSMELFFKDTDVDNHTYTSRMTLTYGASTNMKVLVPNTRIDVTGTVSFKSNFAGATGWGRVAVDNGDYLLSVTVGNGQDSAKGWFIVPGGGPGSTLRYIASSEISAYGALNVAMTNIYEWVDGTPPPTDLATPPPPPKPVASGSEILGSRIEVTEIEGWTGTWIRRPGTDIFDATWQNSNGRVATDVIRVAKVEGRKVVLDRDGMQGSYSGTVSPDGRSIIGTATWYPSGATWSGRISNGNSNVVLPDQPTIILGGPDQETPPDTLMTPPDGPQWNDSSDTGSSETLLDNWNIAGCDLTRAATLDFSRAVHLERFELWIKWTANERTMKYRVSKGNRDIGGGTLTRGACDPIQGAWCVGADAPGVDLSRGQYTISIGRDAICQNSGSGGQGFIRAWGEKTTGR